MNIRDIMSTLSACVTPQTTVREVADTMGREDSGAIPITRDGQLMGISITDRDITVRVMAKGRDPGSVHVEDEGVRLVGLVTMGDLAQKLGPAQKVGAAEQGISRGA